MSIGCCNECGYKANYIIDNNNYDTNDYENLEQVPYEKMLCGVCYDIIIEENVEWILLL